jgi:epoxyqueuosine reductase QueG
MAFFEFNQNNTGGSFDFDEKRGISHWVIIEAANAQQANERAESIGLYFNGCDDGVDCSCCGDRWYPQYDEKDGTAEPTIYGEKVERLSKFPQKDFNHKWMKGPEGFIHYLAGGIEPFWL